MNRKSLLTALQVAITLGILWFIFRDPAKRAEMFATLRQADAWWLLAGLLLYGVVEICAGIRWKLLLAVQGVALSWPRTFALLLIGVFFNFFIPGGTGGDVVKIYFLLKETPGHRTAALLSVLVDRIIGLFALIVLAGAIIAARWSWLTATPDTASAVWTTLVILGVSFSGIMFSLHITSFGLVHRLPARFPWRDKIAELALAYSLYGRAWRASLGAFALSIAAHLGYFATFYCAAASLRGSGARIPSFDELCSIMPLADADAAEADGHGGDGVDDWHDGAELVEGRDARARAAQRCGGAVEGGEVAEVRGDGECEGAERRAPCAAVEAVGEGEFGDLVAPREPRGEPMHEPP